MNQLHKNLKMTETIQQLKEDIALLQMKLQKLEETQMTLEKSGEFSIVSYNGETYYRNLYDGICGGWYKTDTDGEVFYLVEDETERKLEKLYQEQVVVKEPKKEQKWGDIVRESVKWCKEHPDESVEDYLTPQTPEQVDAGLRNAMRKAKKDGVFDEPKFLKFELGKTLEELICKCMVDYNSIIAGGLLEDILNNIEKWLPDFQSAAGSQNVDTELLVDGFNDCVRKMKEMLR